MHLAHGTAAALWISGHSGIAGNEAAAKKAFYGANLLLTSHTQQMSKAGAKTWARTATNNNFLTYRNALLERHRLHANYAQSRAPAELQSPRKNLAQLLAARSGHGNFAAYHDRFNYTEAERRCRCGALTSTTHFYYCRLNSHKELLLSKTG